MGRSENDEGFSSAEGYTEIAMSNSESVGRIDEGTRDSISIGRSQTNFNMNEVHYVDASHGVFNHVLGDQTNQITNIAYINAGERRMNIFKWLSPVIPSDNYNEAQEMRVQGTGMWFIESEQFFEWRTTADSFLWIHGKPGCGKTVLSSSIIKDISKLCVDDAGHAYGYFFFDSRDSQKGLQRHEHLIRSLIWQFSGQYNTFPMALIDLYNHCSSDLQQPSMESLQNTLLLILDGFHHAYIVVDALDECTERSKLLKWINEVARWKGGKLHLLATSRQERDIEKGIKPLDPIITCLEGTSVDLDIEAYLHQMLRDSQNWWEWDEEICAQIKRSLSHGAQGMFRWVALQLDELRCCRSRYQIEQQLVCLPKDLYESYDRIIRRTPTIAQGIPCPLFD